MTPQAGGTRLAFVLVWSQDVGRRGGALEALLQVG